ncbi:MAG TPA: hypothetical protein VK837_07505 [Longimicrobiales bacterium]|nr:hypothetical protein [Longimicrobiales bacterium]
MSVTVVVLVFAGLVLLRVVLVGAGAMAIIRPVRSCPACFHDTVPVRKPLLQRIAPAFEWRWCPSCGWESLARRPGRDAWPPPLPPAPPHRVGEAWTWDAGGTG